MNEQNKTNVDAYQILRDAGLTHDEIVDHIFKIYAAYIDVIFDKNPEQLEIESRVYFQNHGIVVRSRRCLPEHQITKH